MKVNLDNLIDLYFSIFDKYSPASFPSTPFSRANIMHRTEEKTNTIMFAARDILRLEAQSGHFVAL